MFNNEFYIDANYIISKYADVARSIADLRDPFLPGGTSIMLIDLFTAITSAASANPDGLGAYLVDGLHLTGAGYKVFADAVLPHIGPEWKDEPEYAPSWVHPHWSVAPPKGGVLKAAADKAADVEEEE